MWNSIVSVPDRCLFIFFVAKKNTVGFYSTEKQQCIKGNNGCLVDFVTFGVVPKSNYTKRKGILHRWQERTISRCTFYLYVHYGLEYLLRRMRKQAQKNNILSIPSKVQVSCN